MIRFAPWLAGLAVIGVLATIAGLFFGPDIGKALEQGGDAWTNLVPLGFVLLVGGGMLYNVVSFVGKSCQGQGRWTELTWDRGQERFTAVFDGVAFFKSPSVELPLSKIVSCEWLLGPESGEPLQLTLHMKYSDRELPLRFRLEIGDLETRAAAYELLLRIARVLDHSHFQVHSIKPRVVAVSTYQNPAEAHADRDGDEYDVLHDDDAAADEESDREFDSDEPEDGEDERPDYPTFEPPPELKQRSKSPPPATTEPTKFALGKPLPIPASSGSMSARGANVVSLPGWETRRFRVEQFVGGLPHAQLDDWRPGERVEVARTGWQSSVKWMFATIAGLVAAFVLGGPLFFLSHAVARPFAASRIETGLAAAVVATLAAWFYLRPIMRARSVVFDWQRKMLEWNEGGERAETSLGDLVRVTVGVPWYVRHLAAAFAPFGSRSQYEVQV